MFINKNYNLTDVRKQVYWIAYEPHLHPAILNKFFTFCLAANSVYDKATDASVHSNTTILNNIFL